MKLSIITVNLNNSFGLELTLKSIFEQSFNDYEVVVIDGASTDGSIEIIKKYSEKISFWISEPDRSIYNAMNKGIEKASGDYCYFLNSGDWFYDKSVLNNVFKLNPVSSIIVGNVVMLREEVARVEKYPNISFNLFFTGTICHQASFIKRSLFSKYGLYDENLLIVADWKFFLVTIVLNFENVLYYDINIAFHDLFGVSITNEKLFYQERAGVLEEHFPLMVLQDYKNNLFLLNKTKRLYSYKLTRLLIRICDAFIRRLEKMRVEISYRRLTSFYRSRMVELSPHAS